jgi:ParB-like chromosome segregation protein Spo0J
MRLDCKRNTSELIPYARNSRTHSEAQIAQIAASIKEFGFTNPVIIDEDNGIIAGHGRVMAAQKLGIDEVPCVQVTGWTKAQKKAYVIADNKLALNAGWDNEMLKLEFEELKEFDFDLDLTGFSPDELSDLLLEPDFQAGAIDDQGKLDELSPKIVTCPYCNNQFDTRGREVE